MTEIENFWAMMWEFGEIRASHNDEAVLDRLHRFPGARLNFAEDLLRHRDDQPALIFKGERQKVTTMTYAQLYDAVARLAKSLCVMGGTAEDRLVGYMPNLPETVISMLAAAPIGAT